MKQILNRLFGEAAENIYTVRVEGQEWYLAKQICYLLGIKNVSLAMRLRNNPLSLNHNDRRKFQSDNINHRRKVWYVSESGFWKLVGRSSGCWPERFQAWVATEITPKILHHGLDGKEVVVPEFPIIRPTVGRP